MIRRLGFVMQYPGGPVDRTPYHIGAAVVVEIAGRHAASRPLLVEDFSRLTRYIDKTLSRVIPKQQRSFPIPYMGLYHLNRVHYIGLRDKQIFSAVVIVVEEADAPARVQQGNRAQPRGERGVIKSAVARVGVEGVLLIGQVSDNDVGPAVVIVVFEIHTHSGEAGSPAVEG